MRVRDASAALEAIVAAATVAGVAVAIAVVDDRGDLVVARRMDGARPRSMPMTIRKAHTAAVMDRDTETFQRELVEKHLDIAYYGDPLLTGLPGGIPIVADDGTTLGGIGVTGKTRGADAQLAAAGLVVFSTGRRTERG